MNVNLRRGDMNSEIQFDGVIEPQFGQIPPDRPQPDLEQIRKAVDRIALSERPVIVAGAGIMTSIFSLRPPITIIVWISCKTSDSGRA